MASPQKSPLLNEESCHSAGFRGRLLLSFYFLHRHYKPTQMSVSFRLHSNSGSTALSVDMLKLWH